MQLLPLDSLTSIFQWLETKDRISCSHVCKLFRQTLVNAEYDSVLWPKKELKKLLPTHYQFPLIKQVLQRQLLGVEDQVTPISFAEKHTTFATHLTSHDNLVIAWNCESKKYAGPITIWQSRLKENRPTCNLASAAPVTAEHPFGICLAEVTVHENWLIRTTYDPLQDEQFLLLDIWELDKKSGEAKEVITQKIPVNPPRINSNAFSLAPPVCHGNSLFLPIPYSNMTQVWDLEGIPRYIESIGNPYYRYVKDLVIHDGVLIIKTFSGCTTIDLKGSGKKVDQLYLTHGSTAKQFYYRADDNGQLLLTDLSRQKEGTEPDFILAADLQDRKCGYIRVTDNWLIGDFQRKNQKKGFSIFNLSTQTKDGSAIPEYGFIPRPIGDSIRTLVGWHQLVLSFQNKCLVYSLWDLRADGAPNKLYELPQDTKIMTTAFHNGLLIAATNDGKIWKFPV